MKLNNMHLRYELLRNDMSQKDLSSKTGISYSMINAICNGRSCSEDTISKIAKVLDVPAEKLLKK